MKARLIHGDCLAVLHSMPDECVDSVVTDPPYNLSSGLKSDTDCLSERLAQVQFPQDDEWYARVFEGSDLDGPAIDASALGRVDGTIGVDAGIGVPVGAVDFDSPSVVQHEVYGGDPPALSSTDANLSSVGNAESIKLSGHFVLQVADHSDSAFCHGSCCCFAELAPGLWCVPVVVPGDAGGSRFGSDGFPVHVSDSDVGLCNDSFGQPEGSALVMTGSRAIHRAVLRLDLRRGTGELDTTSRALDHHRPLLLLPAQDVRTRLGAGGSSSVLGKAIRVRQVGGPADWTFTLDFLSHFGESSRSAGGFMGKEWDGWWSSQASFQRWCMAWAAECLRVLKPGGHLLAFGGTRTFHRLVTGVEDAGFEIRDTVQWLHGQGFPKSMDISKAIDKMSGKDREVVRQGKPVKRMIPGADQDKTGSWIKDNGREYVPVETRPATDEAEQWAGWGTALKPAYEPIILARKPLGEKTVAKNVLTYGTGALNIDATRVAVNGDKLGGGAETKTTADQKGNEGWERPWMSDDAAQEAHAAQVRENVVKAEQQGRWPANLALTHHPECEVVGTKRVYTGPGGPIRVGQSGADNDARNVSESIGRESRVAGHENINHRDEDGTEVVEDWRCHPDCPIALLDAQSGERLGFFGGGTRGAGFNTEYVGGDKKETVLPANYFNDKGGASRFYNTFPPDEAQGRWPANVALSHAEGCKRLGTTTETIGGGSKDSLTDATTVAFAQGYEGGDGFDGHEVANEVWECVDDCPVRLLDEQSGERKASGIYDGDGELLSDGITATDFGGGNRPAVMYGDKGGASRYYNTFEGETRFKYQPKAPRKERNAGLSDYLRVDVGDVILLVEDGRVVPAYGYGVTAAEADEWTALLGPGDEREAVWAGLARLLGPIEVPAVRNGNQKVKVTFDAPVAIPGGVVLEGEVALSVGQWRSTHPTVKAKGLMEWLAKLITPPGGVVLDPFAGSGSTGLGVMAVPDASFVGIEREREYVYIADHRLAASGGEVTVEPFAAMEAVCSWFLAPGPGQEEGTGTRSKATGLHKNPVASSSATSVPGGPRNDVGAVAPSSKPTVAPERPQRRVAALPEVPRVQSPPEPPEPVQEPAQEPPALRDFG